MIDLETTDRGVLLPVRAQAGARASALRGEQAGALKVAVTQVAEKGKANQAILKLLSKRLGLARSQLELVSGATHAQKRILVTGITREQLADRIAHAVAAPGA